MKKIAALALAVLMLLAVVSCGGKPADDAGAAAGGWTLHTDEAQPAMSEEAAAAFEKAAASYDAETLTPVALLGTQVVAGINYLVLCRADSALKVAKVYADLSGGAQILSVVDFDFTAPAAAGSGEALLGGWTGYAASAAVLPADGPSESLAAALEASDAVSFEPTVYLASQVVAGANYAFLGNAAIDGGSAPAILIVYRQPDGSSSVTSCTVLDLASYSGN